MSSFTSVEYYVLAELEEAAQRHAQTAERSEQLARQDREEANIFAEAVRRFKAQGLTDEFADPLAACNDFGSITWHDTHEERMTRLRRMLGLLPATLAIDAQITDS